jgi:hypothetical protein
VSDFLLNLLRRGAGLPPAVAPRRPEPPGELFQLDRSAAEDAGASAGGPSAASGRPISPLAAGSPAPAPSAPTAASPSGVMAPAAAEGQRPASPAAPPRATPPGTDRREGPQPWPVARSTGDRVEAPPPVSPRPAPLAPARPAPRAAPRATVPPEPAPATLPPQPLAPLAPEEARARPPAREESAGPQEPRIEVHIGRIEVRPPAAPPPRAPAPRREPRGFLEHALARRYLDRRCY